MICRVFLKNKLFMFVVLALSFCGSLLYAQIDDLDENSFDQPEAAVNRSNGGSPTDDAFVDELNDFDQNPAMNSETATQDPNLQQVNPKNTDFDPNAPEFDQGAIPDTTNPEILSNQIRDMNPDSLTGEQDYFPSFIYDERGRKDPFAPKLKAADKYVQPQFQEQQAVPTEEERIRAGLAKFEVSALTLTAILIGKQNRPKALIKDPAGTVYVIHENDVVGRNNGVVKKIRQGQVVILEYRDQPEGDRLYTTQVLSLGK